MSMAMASPAIRISTMSVLQRCGSRRRGPGGYCTRLMARTVELVVLRKKGRRSKVDSRRGKNDTGKAYSSQALPRSSRHVHCTDCLPHRPAAIATRASCWTDGHRVAVDGRHCYTGGQSVTHRERTLSGAAGTEEHVVPDLSRSQSADRWDRTR